MQKYIILAVVMGDMFTVLSGRCPATWDEFCENNKLFTGYSAIYYHKISILTLIFAILCKIVALIQIIIALDLLILSFFKKKIKYFDNGIYITLVVNPWIYINLIKISIKKVKIDKKIGKVFILNILFLNIGMSGKRIIMNTFILTKEGENGKKHEYLPLINFIKFLRLMQKYNFNETNLKYRKYFTY